jgi:hypothetical protein
MQGGLQQLEIVGGRLFGEFDHHLARRNAEVVQQLQGTPRLVRGFEQGFRGDVEEQLARQLLLVEASAGARGRRFPVRSSVRPGGRRRTMQ